MIVTTLEQPTRTLGDDLVEWCRSAAWRSVSTLPNGAITPQASAQIHAEVTSIFRRHGEEPPSFEVRMDIATGELTLGDPAPLDQVFCGPDGKVAKSWRKR